MTCPYCNSPRGDAACPDCGTSIGYVPRKRGKVKPGIPASYWDNPNPVRTIAWDGAEEIGRRGLLLSRYAFDDKPAIEQERAE